MLTTYVIVREDEDPPYYVSKSSMRHWPIWTRSDEDILRFPTRSHAHAHLLGARSVTRDCRIVKVQQ